MDQKKQLTFQFQPIIVQRFGYSFEPTNAQELIDWCEKQSAFFSKFSAQSNVYQPDVYITTITNHCRQLGSLSAHAQSLLAAENSGEEPSFVQALQAIQQIVQNNLTMPGLPPADSAVSLQLKPLIENEPDIFIPALFALSNDKNLVNTQIHFWPPRVARGFGIGAALSAGMASGETGVINALNQAADSKIERAAANVARSQKKVEIAVNTLNTKISELDTSVIGFNTEHSARLTKTETETTEVIEKCKSEIEKFTSFVKNQIALKAPVTYWEEKAVNHENRAFFLGWVTFLLMFISAIGLSSRVSELATFVGKGSDANYAGIVVIFITCTLTFWGLRLLVRLFLSQQHLGTDARERVAMVKTYLALQEAGHGPKGDDIAPVLVALFRTSSDGIVKDESMPPVIAELLTRASKPN
jgi:Family of unknown function (DUF6161)